MVTRLRTSRKDGRRNALILSSDPTCSHKMIVSHQHRFVFAAIPKTGTHSVRQALRAHLGPEDTEQVGLFVNKRLPYEALAQIQHGHIGLDQVRPHLGEDAFRSYFKFAFVRNPYDRFVSYCAFMRRGDGAFTRQPQAVMRHILFKMRPLNHILFQPQHTLLVDAQGRLLADYIGRVEQMQACYDEICTRIGFSSQALERVNRSSRGDYRQYYDQVLMDGVSELYRRDLDLFNYEF